LLIVPTSEHRIVLNLHRADPHPFGGVNSQGVGATVTELGEELEPELELELDCELELELDLEEFLEDEGRPTRPVSI
jgi:hypothetical protein